MLFYTWQETLAMLIAAILLDLVIGDPRRPVHPVIRIGGLIRRLEARLYPLPLAEENGPGHHGLPASSSAPMPQAVLRRRGVLLTLVTLAVSFLIMLALLAVSRWVHPWLGYAVNTWFISTTIAIKGLKDAALQVYRPLTEGNLPEARRYTGYIVGRDTAGLEEPELTRAAVETVAENTVDAVVSPLFYALLGGAPLAMLYRAANTLDSMVGYRNERYAYFGWASARLDDGLNWLPARLTGLLLIAAAALSPGLSGRRAFRSMMAFAHKHPSPNSGIPESAAAGAMGIELGGRNVYGGTVSERARMGWPLRPLQAGDIQTTVGLLYKASLGLGGIMLCVLILFGSS
ncbi:adenosylcobinamide-phosphate synthase CbiB [Paenibacillus aurantius]|uniref:Cobalamin biosynthesis protein CobD n=1 Tax=Paenibacillus aurantius TaxID=2918900 RepID=A0AA96LBL0_9BACL|nr:adenosylcobinamide-phosphate synthase CbiB [Paenibacillus aurantius]WNQ10230.1 adenosylcobinamide-phosphate synthase CbiB [Paenibacillus aurantius]